MSDAATLLTTPVARSWLEANRVCVELELQRLRCLLRRRVRWLRTQWKQDPLRAYQGLVISDEQADGLMVGEDRFREARFYEQDPESVAIAGALGQIERRLLDLRSSPAFASAPAALDALVQSFDLTAFERNTVILCFGLELDSTLERLYAYVQDDVRRKYATPQLALDLFATLPNEVDRCAAEEAAWEVRDSFVSGAPLRRFRLVAMDPPPMPAGSSLTSPLRLDLRVSDFLRGVNVIDDRIADLLRLSGPALLPQIHRDLVKRLVQCGDSRVDASGLKTLNLVGPRSAGKQAVARSVCDGLGLELHVLDPAVLPPSRSERNDLLALVDRDMVLMRSAIYVAAPDVARGDPAVGDCVRQIIDRSKAFCIIGSEDPWLSERPLTVVAVPKPDAASQRAVWREALASVPHAFNGEIDKLVEQFDLSAGTIMQVVAHAHDRVATLATGTDVTPDAIWQASRVIARTRLDDLAQRVASSYTWDDIVLPADVLRQLQEIANQVAHRFQVLETWGFGARLGRGRGISVLFSGPSGTGKTMAAEILANHLQLDLYRIDLAGVVSKYIGETEKNLRRVFDAAEASGAILFFDEADALFGKRSEVKDSHDRYANIEVDYLLQRMEDYRGLAILATNRKTALDRAFLRRLRFLVEFPSPDAADRRRIWEKVFPAAAAVDAFELDELARLEIPGGNIRNIALNAAFLAASDGQPIGTPHVMRAARREYAKIDKLMTPSEFGRYHNMVIT